MNKVRSLEVFAKLEVPQVVCVGLFTLNVMFSLTSLRVLFDVSSIMQSEKMLFANFYFIDVSGL